jgi:hypothetical protein
VTGDGVAALVEDMWRHLRPPEPEE